MNKNINIQSLIDYHKGRAKSYDLARKRICWHRDNKIEFSKRENKKLQHEMDKLTRKYHMHIDTVAILQEKAEREKGCSCCSGIYDDTRFYKEFEKLNLFHEISCEILYGIRICQSKRNGKSYLKIESEFEEEMYTEIMSCPMCGRKLEIK